MCTGSVRIRICRNDALHSQFLQSADILAEDNFMYLAISGRSLLPIRCEVEETALCLRVVGNIMTQSCSSCL